jgi:hypothetical protein
MDRPNVIFHPKRPHRPRRFFGVRGVVRRLRRPAPNEEARPRRSLPTDTDRALQSERARFAAKIDG